jgi:hypothetical protein
MTPTQKIKKHLLTRLENWRPIRLPALNTGEEVDNAYEMYLDLESDTLQDLRYEVREGQVNTDIQPFICNTRLLRDYDASSVAMQMDDGSWVGWTYWSGGGRHGESHAIQWMEDAIELTCTEKQVMVTERTFTKV